MISLDKRRLEHPLQQELTAAVADANAVIEFVISYDPQLSGMSTRLTAVALSNEGEYLVANVGDSRTYLHRAGRLPAPDPRPEPGGDADRPRRA